MCYLDKSLVKLFPARIQQSSQLDNPNVKERLSGKTFFVFPGAKIVAFIDISKFAPLKYGSCIKEPMDFSPIVVVTYIHNEIFFIINVPTTFDVANKIGIIPIQMLKIDISIVVYSRQMIQ